MCRCGREISAVLTGRYGQTRDVPCCDQGGHSGHGRHGRRGAGRGTRWVTSPITELTAPITVVSALVTAITVLLTAVKAPVTAVTAPVMEVKAPNTADTAPARRVDVGTPVRRLLRVPRRRSRASEAAKRQAWRVVGDAGRCRQPRWRQSQGAAFTIPYKA